MIAPADQPRRTTLTDAQRAKIFALASERGLTHDDLRKLTPRGSIRALSPREAHRLIDELQGRNQSRGPTEPTLPGRVNAHIPLHRPRAAPGVIRLVSPEQSKMIADYKARLAGLWGCGLHGVDEFLRNRHHPHGAPLTQVNDGKDAQCVIIVLKRVVENIERRKAADTNQSPAADAAHRRQRIAASSATS